MDYSHALKNDIGRNCQGTVRQAHRDDQAILVDLIYASGPEIFEFLFTTKTVSARQFLQHATARPKGLLGYENHSVYELAGQVIATGAFYSGGFDYINLALGVISPVFQAYKGQERWQVVDRLRRLDRLMPPPSRNMLYIAHLAVATGYQGQGIGTQLIEYHRPDHHSRYKVYALDVAQTNVGAKALYEKLGFQVVGKHSLESANENQNVPDLWRMEYTL